MLHAACPGSSSTTFLAANADAVVYCSVYYLFKLLEWWLFRESLLYLRNVQRSACLFVFLILLLPWNRAMFVWAW